jgi:xylan 1,4-beta-xylosidase
MKKLLSFCQVASLCIMTAYFQSNAATYSLNVNGATSLGSWSHFYEECVGSDHPITVLSSSYGRNIQNALRRGRAECGFKRIRAHNILNDAPIYSEVNGTPVYNWTLVDQIYDTVKAIGMTVIVELSGVPTALASGTKTGFWYNGTPMNTTLPKDYNKWRDLIKAFVQHLEQRYGVDEIRKNWAFEVWNEPNLTGFTIQDYCKLYDYAADGVRLADSLCKVGGPASSGGDPGWIDQFAAHVVSGTNYATGKTGSKCEFISYHRYADDSPYNGAPSKFSCPVGMNLYHKGMVDLMNKNKFKGELQNTEWAPTWQTLPLHSDDESSGSFIAKTIHLLEDNNQTLYPVPTIYSFWCISDIFEEWGAGSTTAFDKSYGLFVRGDKNIPDSWEVPKASYNAFRLLHKLTDTRIACTGGTTGDGVNGCATLGADNKSLQVLLYNHVDSGAANSALSDSIELTVNNIPFLPGAVRVEYWLLDRTHSSCYRVWQSMGSPKIPTAAQWAQLKAAAALVCAQAPDSVTLAQQTFTKKFHLNTYGVELLNLTAVPTTALREHAQSSNKVKQTLRIGRNQRAIELPSAVNTPLNVFDLNGSLALTVRADAQGQFTIDMSRLAKGTYIVADAKGAIATVNRIVVAR